MVELTQEVLRQRCSQCEIVRRLSPTRVITQCVAAGPNNTRCYIWKWDEDKEQWTSHNLNKDENRLLTMFNFSEE